MRAFDKADLRRLLNSGRFSLGKVLKAGQERGLRILHKELNDPDGHFNGPILSPIDFHIKLLNAQYRLPSFPSISFWIP